MRDVILYMSMSLDGFVSSDREHPGTAIYGSAETQPALEGSSGPPLLGRNCRFRGRLPHCGKAAQGPERSALPFYSDTLWCRQIRW